MLPSFLPNIIALINYLFEIGFGPLGTSCSEAPNSLPLGFRPLVLCSGCSSIFVVVFVAGDDDSDGECSLNTLREVLLLIGFMGLNLGLIMRETQTKRRRRRRRRVLNLVVLVLVSDGGVGGGGWAGGAAMQVMSKKNNHPQETKRVQYPSTFQPYLRRGRGRGGEERMEFCKRREETLRGKEDREYIIMQRQGFFLKFHSHEF